MFRKEELKEMIEEILADKIPTTVIHEDIDEKLADDEESENMRDSDKIPGNESEDDYNGT